MTFWTVLWIGFIGGPMDGQHAFVVYPDLAACEAATAQISATLDYDHSLECQETPAARTSIRPQRRPADG